MADYYRILTGNWDDTPTLSWSATSGGAAAGYATPPTAADDVYLDANTGAVTITIAAAATCKNLDCTGFTGTLAGTSTLAVSGTVFKLVSGMGYTYTGTLTFNATSGTTAITSGTKTMDQPITFNGAGGTFQLQDNLTSGATRTATLTAGTLDIQSFTLATGIFSSNNANTRVITGAGTINLTNASGTTTVWNTTDQTNMTGSGFTGLIQVSGANSSTRTIQMDGSPAISWPSVTISGGSGNMTLTNFNCLNYTQTSGYTGPFQNGLMTIRGNFTLDPANGTPANTTNAISFTATSGTKTITTAGKTINCPFTFNGAGGTWQLQDNLTSGATRVLTLTAGTLDIQGFTASFSGFSSTGTGTRALIGSGTISAITTTGATAWDTTDQTNMTGSGFTGTIAISGASSGRAIVMDSSPVIEWPSILVSAGSGTLTLTNVNCLNYTQTSGYTGIMGSASPVTVRGNLALDAANGAPEAGTGVLTFAAASGTKTINAAGKTIDRPITVNAPGATHQLAAALTMGSTRTLTHTAGTLDLNDFNLAAAAYSSSNSNTRALDLGTGTHTLSAAASAWDIGTSTGMTLTPGTSTIVLSDAAADFLGGGLTYYDLRFSTAGGTVVITGSNTFHGIATPVPGTAMTLNMTAGTTTHVTTFDVNGAVGALVTLKSATSATHALVADGAPITCTFLDISYSVASPAATWIATSSIDSGNNTGWSFASGMREFTSAMFMARSRWRKRLLALLLLLFAACDFEVEGFSPEVVARYRCKQRVCAHLAECSPIVAGLGWDWRTRKRCMQTMWCGSNLVACEAAVGALTCIGPGATPWLHSQHAGGVDAIRQACMPLVEWRGGGEVVRVPVKVGRP